MNAWRAVIFGKSSAKLWDLDFGYPIDWVWTGCGHLQSNDQPDRSTATHLGNGLKENILRIDFQML